MNKFIRLYKKTISVVFILFLITFVTIQGKLTDYLGLIFVGFVACLAIFTFIKTWIIDDKNRDSMI